MRVSQLAPSPRLAPWVKCFSVVETDVQATRTLVPDGRASLGVRWAGAASLLLPKHALRVADCSLSGPRAQARVMRTEANSGLVLAVFHDGGASAFLDAPLSEHFGVCSRARTSRVSINRSAKRQRSRTRSKRSNHSSSRESVDGWIR